MSHAAYLFLINDDYNDAEFVGPVSDYLEHQCDENNWYQLCVKVRQNGEVVQLCPSNDWRGRDGWYEGYEKIPAQERWDNIVHLAKECVYYEIESALRTLTEDYKYELPLDVNIKEIKELIRTKIVEVFSREPDESKRDFMYWYGLERLANIVSQLRSVESEELFFTDEEENPYKTIRAIDYREFKYDMVTHEGTYNNQNLAIILVDIHT